MPEKVLFVDDDPNLLAACRRSLRKDFEVETAASGQEGLERVSDQGPFAVILADMRMPSMDGIQFLTIVQQTACDSVRMMLTGNADQETAINAVNEGHIFRFLTKPCPKETQVKAVQAGIDQYRLIVAEKQLLEETLNGSIKVMTDILSFVNPKAFGRASRVRRYARHIVEALSLPDLWKYEVAAMLSQIGCLTLPRETMERVYAGQELLQEEQEAFASHPDVGERLIGNIPRMEDIAHMISRQQEPFAWNHPGAQPSERDAVTRGGHVLRVAIDFDDLLSHGIDPQAALRQLRQQPQEYDPELVDALSSLTMRPNEALRRTVGVDQLDVHMILDQNVTSSKGQLLITCGQEITTVILELLRRWSQGIGVAEPISVLIPQFSDL